MARNITDLFTIHPNLNGYISHLAISTKPQSYQPATYSNVTFVTYIHQQCSQSNRITETSSGLKTNKLISISDKCRQGINRTINSIIWPQTWTLVPGHLAVFSVNHNPWCVPSTFAFICIYDQGREKKYFLDFDNLDGNNKLFPYFWFYFFEVYNHTLSSSSIWSNDAGSLLWRLQPVQM